MIISDGYSLVYEQNKNRIVINLPQTQKTIMNTLTLPVKRHDRSEGELMVLLQITRLLFDELPF